MRIKRVKLELAMSLYHLCCTKVIISKKCSIYKCMNAGVDCNMFNQWVGTVILNTIQKI